MALRLGSVFPRMSLCCRRPRLLAATRTFSTTTTTRMGADGHPAWLQRVLEDRAPAPRVYRWTVADVVGRDKTTPTTTTTTTAAADSGPGPGYNPQRIYILGVGNLGRLFATALAQLPDRPPITLVVHRPELLDQWHQKPGIVLLTPADLTTPGTEAAGHEPRFAAHAGIDVEMWSDTPPPGAEPMAAELPLVANLVVATKAQAALDQVDRVRRYLSPLSTVAFVQNGMNRLWPPAGDAYNVARYRSEAPEQHPRWVACVVTHGVLSLGPYASVLAAPADVKLGTVDHQAHLGSSSSSPYLVQQLLAAPVLQAQELSRPALWVTQLEKLAVNAVINPLTALLRCRNGVLFESKDEEESGVVLQSIIDRLLLEASSVFEGLANSAPIRERILGSEDEEGQAELLRRLSYDNLRAMVYRVGTLVKDNTSSMLQDVRAGRPTEVREFNGWIVDTAAELGKHGGVQGLDVRGHQAMVRLVEAGKPLTRKELSKHFEGL